MKGAWCSLCGLLFAVACSSAVEEPYDEAGYHPDTTDTGMFDTAMPDETLTDEEMTDEATEGTTTDLSDDPVTDQDIDDAFPFDDAITDNAPHDDAAVTDADVPEVVCWEPEVIIAIDRTLSMRVAVNGVTKWDMACQAIAAIGEKFAYTVRFGLEFFPKTAEGCYTIAEIEAGSKVNNELCMEGEVVVPPAYDNDELINTTMLEAQLCRSSPIKSALLSARDYYVAHPPEPAARKQFVILITDGKETCEKATLSCGAQELLAAGVQTFVVGFGGGVNQDYLNHLVCAGGTAPDPNACLTGQSGCTEAYLGIDPLYFTAEDGDQLLLQLDEIAARVAECQS